MEYTCEFLRKCHGLRFRATLNNKPQEGIIKVTREGVMLCYGEKDPGYLVTFGRRDTLSFSKQTFAILPVNFEIVPRDPETYKDWQVGDRVAMPCSDNDNNYTIIIFRAGELVVFKKPTGDGRWEGYNPYTCEELFEKGWRLILTDIEKQIIEEKKQAEWEPQDGDICYVKAICSEWLFIKKGDISKTETCACISLSKDCVDLSPGHVTRDDMIKELRPATDAEKQRLFDALAKAGKRWNAEKKVVEDIPEETKTAEYDYTKFAPVLVRNSPLEYWKPSVFYYMKTPSCFPFVMADETEWGICLPLNDKTAHLLGTNDDYEEEDK